MSKLFTPYGHKPRYLVAKGDDGGIARVLPMFLLESRVFGRKLVSVPFAPYGVVCVDDAGPRRALVDGGGGECGCGLLDIQTLK